MEPSSRTEPIPLGPSPREIQVGLRWNIVAGMLAMIWLTLPGTPLTMLMECLGADALRIGLLVSIQQMAMILQIPGALIGGLFRRRKHIWAFLALIHRLVWFAPVLLLAGSRFAGSNGIRLLLAMVTVSSVFAQLSVSTWHGWMADLVPEHQRSRFWGMRQSLLWLVYTPALLLFGFLLDAFPDPRHPGGHYAGFALVFVLGALAGCLDVVAHLKVPEPPPVPVASGRRLRQRIGAPFRNRDFSFLTAAMVVWYFNLGLVGSFSILFLTRKFGFSYSQLAVLNLSASLAVIFGGLLWGYFIKRTGARSFLISTLLVSPVFALVWFLLRNTAISLPLPWLGVATLAQPMLVLSVGNFVSSLFYSGIGLCQLNMLSALTPREDRSMAMAVHWTAVGLGSSLGPLAGGLLVDWFEVRFPMPAHPPGFQFGFMHALAALHALIAWLAVLPLVRRLRPNAGELAVGATLSRMFIGNPLRLVGNILMMDTASTSRSRVRAVRGVGRLRLDLAVNDLIGHLRNPSTSVRIAAVAALGRIGNRDAVAALARELGRDDTGLTLDLLRALRHAADPAALPAVVPLLRNDSIEAARAAARVLGVFRDRRAVAPLMEVLASTRDGALIAACAEALETLGDPSAVGTMLSRLTDLTNPVLQMTVAVAAANLFSNREGFYRLVENEGRHPGTLADSLLDELSEATRLLKNRNPDVAVEIERHMQAVRRRIISGDMDAALISLRELAIAAAGMLFGRVPEEDPSRRLENVAAQDERFGAVLGLIENLVARIPDGSAQQPADSFSTPAPPLAETARDGLGTPLALALYCLSTVLKGHAKKSR